MDLFNKFYWKNKKSDAKIGVEVIHSLYLRNISPKKEKFYNLDLVYSSTIFFIVSFTSSQEINLKYTGSGSKSASEK